MIHGNHVSFISRSNAKGFSMFQDFSDVFRDLSRDGRAIQDFSKFQALLISRNESFERSRCRDFCRTQYLLFPPSLLLWVIVPLATTAQSSTTGSSLSSFFPFHLSLSLSFFSLSFLAAPLQRRTDDYEHK